MAVAGVVAGAIPALPIPPQDMTEQVMVSATVLSSDLFTPYQEPRVTLPTIGEQEQALQPLGGKLWGGNLAEYGGIGGLPYLGIHRVKDLPVSRSHRHYQSGLTKHDGGPQPYRQTQLKLSDCRVNDQRLPTPMKTDPSKLEWERHDPSSWPGFHAYTSHRPRFEVFPSGDTDKPPSTAASAQTTPGTRLSQPLSESTRNAISDLNRRLYQRTSYQDSFPDYTIELRRTAAATSLPSRLQKLGVLPVCGSEFGDSIYVPVFSDETEATNTERTLEERRIEDKDDKGEAEGDVGQDENAAEEGDQENAEEEDAEIGAPPEMPPPSTEAPESDTSQIKKSRSTSKSVSFNETPQIMEDTIKMFTIIPNKPMTGVGPCWPPSTSHVINDINGSQLLERNDITQYPPAYRSALKQIPKTEDEVKITKQKRPPTSSKGRKETRATTITDGGPTPSSTIPPAPPLNPALIRHNLAAKRCAPLQPLSASQKALVMLSQYDDYDEEVFRELNLSDDTRRPFVVPSSYRHSMMSKSVPSTLPALKKSKSKVFSWSAPPSSKRPLALPPAPLSDCLVPSGRRVPHRLGLRYKTEAHKRYHSIYPDSVPDLRNSQYDGGKRYFFFDNHSSVFRG